MSRTSVVLRIDGMTCTSCEQRIERDLMRLSGIISVHTSYRDGTAQIVYDADRVTIPMIQKCIEDSGYRIANEHAPSSTPRRAMVALGIAVALFGVYLLAQHLGLLDLMNLFPEAQAGMGYGMLFVIGLLTSVHCVAMCGGINLSQCIPQHANLHHKSADRLGAMRAGFLYNLGRVASYTIIGGIVGAVGSVVSFTGAARGIVMLVAGLFMVIMGLNMLNLFPWLRKFNPRMPKFFAQRAIKGRSSNRPLYVGLLNGLMPCGPLQAMQIYALSTGDPLKGAMSMLLFSLGTVPLMFGLGALSSFLSQRFTRKMLTVGAVLVLMLGLGMFANGLNLSGIGAPLPRFDAPAPETDIVAEAPAPTQTAQPEATEAPEAPAATDAAPAEEVQLVTTELSARRYEPITVKAGVKVRWTIHAEPGTINGCNNAIVIPALNYYEKKLTVGDNVIEFTPKRAGTYPYSCWMGMITSTITVVDG